MAWLTFSYYISQKLYLKLSHRDAIRKAVTADTGSKFDLGNEWLTNDDDV